MTEQGFKCIMLKHGLIAGCLLFAGPVWGQTDNEDTQKCSVQIDTKKLWSQNARPWELCDEAGGVLIGIPPPRTWHLMTQTVAGDVVIIGGLSHQECEDKMKNLNWSCWSGNAPTPCRGSGLPEEIKNAECFR